MKRRSFFPPRKAKRKRDRDHNFSDPHAVPDRAFVGRFHRLDSAEREKIRQLHRDFHVPAGALARRFDVTREVVLKILRAQQEPRP